MLHAVRKLDGTLTFEDKNTSKKLFPSFTAS